MTRDGACSPVSIADIHGCDVTRAIASPFRSIARTVPSNSRVRFSKWRSGVIGDGLLQRFEPALYQLSDRAASVGLEAHE